MWIEYLYRSVGQPSKVGQTDLLSVCDQSSSVVLCMHDYKSLHIHPG